MYENIKIIINIPPYLYILIIIYKNYIMIIIA